MADGLDIPVLGLGVYRVQPGAQTYETVKEALAQGYRMVDTAQMYGNEADVGRAIRDSGIPREDIYVMSKVDTNSHGYEATIASVRESAKKMGLDYLDMFIIHSPFGGKLVETYDALLKLKEEGLLRSVGVSNFNVGHINALTSRCRPAPALNQFEVHPYNYNLRQDLVRDNQERGIVVQAYGSLLGGGVDPAGVAPVAKAAERTGKTPGQVLLRWAVQKGFQLIPKSVHPARIGENADVFGFELSAGEMEALDGLPQRTTVGYWNPVDGATVDLGRTTLGKGCP